MKEGKGKWRSGRGLKVNQYDGEFKLGQKSGFGEFRWASGNYYKGEFKQEERHGYGEMYWSDGSCYSGDWFQGV